MAEITGTLKTTIIADDSKDHVYRIIREFDTDGDEAILLTLYPTLTEPNTFDLSSMHLMNHASDEGMNLKKVHFVYLFSKVVHSKLSTKGLTVDEENMNYLRDIISQLKDAKIIIAYGSSMEKCQAVIESKVRIFRMIKELRPDDALWQIGADGLEEESPHILFCGIRCHNIPWKLRHYVVPFKYTEQGYKEYLANKEALRERFIQNVASKKGATEKTETEPAEKEAEKTEEKGAEQPEEKPKKGKKKNEDTQS